MAVAVQNLRKRRIDFLKNLSDIFEFDYTSFFFFLTKFSNFEGRERVSASKAEAPWPSVNIKDKKKENKIKEEKGRNADKGNNPTRRSDR